ncbi:MAG: eight-cysteine-cluster domain-containing protein [Nitrospinae bacterium]|nr:eight-cysteine-cluster domain-containing protein [Nitrospinota bacterium]
MKVRPIIVALWLVAASATGCDVHGATESPPAEAGFCGGSTDDACATDDDCLAAGCSGQLCQSAAREQPATTCEWKECYDASRYGLSCGCDAGACRWHGDGEGTAP